MCGCRLLGRVFARWRRRLAYVVACLLSRTRVEASFYQGYCARIVCRAMRDVLVAGGRGIFTVVFCRLCMRGHARPAGCWWLLDVMRRICKLCMSWHAWSARCWRSCVAIGCVRRVVYVVACAGGCIRRVPDGDRGSAARCVCIGIRESPLVGWLGLWPVVFRQLCMCRHAYRRRCWWIWERTWGDLRVAYARACVVGWMLAVLRYYRLYLASCVCRGVHNSPDVGGLGLFAVMFRRLCVS